MNMKKLLPISIAFFVVLFIVRFTPQNNSDLKAGGIYSAEYGDGRFCIVKVLVPDDEVTHIRIYKNKFPQRPDTIDTSILSLGSIDEGEDNVGIGHLPITTEEFLAWEPKLILETELTEEELEGYELWKESEGEVF